jgi:DNA polymerase I-like protein with 3'-5' exonuclease and polymerase domains
VNAPIQTPPAEALIYATADYDGLELRSMAQACLLLVGESRLAQVLNAGEDPHLIMAAAMLGISYPEAQARHKAEKEARAQAFDFFKGKIPDASGRLIPSPLEDTDAAKRAADCVPAPVDDARQAGKVADFGFPGGLGAEKLVLFARKAYKVRLAVDDEQSRATGLPSAKALKRTWLATFPEFRKYFDAIGRMVGENGATFRHFFTGRVRGGAHYAAACNSFFQGLGADATGHALFLISEACYTPQPCRGCNGAGGPCCFWTGVSALYGCRLVNYIHDEYMIECPEARGHEVAHELVRIMIEGAAPFLPNVPATAEPKLMRFWSKDAKQVWSAPKGDPTRRLVAWPKAA